MNEKTPPLVGIIMGSDSDWPTMEAAWQVCQEFAVPAEVSVVSAHRTPDDMARYAARLGPQFDPPQILLDNAKASKTFF